jgi:putative flippase GtrA
MYQNLNSIVKKKNFPKYCIIGLCNTIFSYFSGILFFYFCYENFGALFVTAVASLINIFFSFLNYKFFFFKTETKYFFTEYLKINFFQFFLIFLNSLMLWILIEKINVNIYFTQFILSIINVIISTIINFKFVFKNK